MFFRRLGVIADLVKGVRPLPYWGISLHVFSFFFSFCSAFRLKLQHQTVFEKVICRASKTLKK